MERFQAVSYPAHIRLCAGTSRIVARDGNRLVVEQQGVEVQGPLRFGFHSVREVDLSPPFEMAARLIRGSMRVLEGSTRLARTSDATLVKSRGRLDPGHWVPTLVAPRNGHGGGEGPFTQEALQ